MQVTLDSPVDDRKIAKKKENRCFKIILKVTQENLSFPFVMQSLPFSNGT